MSNVTATSKQSYATNDVTNQREQVAAFLLQRTFAGRLTSDKDVERETGIPANLVSARRNELFESRYFAHGVFWIPAMMPDKRDRVTGNRVNAWAMVVFTGEDMITMKRKTVEFITKIKQK